MVAPYNIGDRLRALSEPDAQPVEAPQPVPEQYAGYNDHPDNWSALRQQLQGGPMQLAQNTPMGEPEALVRGAAQGMTAGYMPEVSGAMGAAAEYVHPTPSGVTRGEAARRAYEDISQNVGGEQERAMLQQPAATVLGNMGGSLLPGSFIGKGVAGVTRGITGRIKAMGAPYAAENAAVRTELTASQAARQAADKEELMRQIQGREMTVEQLDKLLGKMSPAEYRRMMKQPPGMADGGTVKYADGGVVARVGEEGEEDLVVIPKDPEKRHAFLMRLLHENSNAVPGMAEGGVVAENVTPPVPPRKRGLLTRLFGGPAVEPMVPPPPKATSQQGVEPEEGERSVEDKEYYERLRKARGSPM